MRIFEDFIAFLHLLFALFNILLFYGDCFIF